MVIVVLICVERRERQKRERRERQKREKWLCFVYRDWREGFKGKMEMTRESAAFV